jgi:chromosome partitioning protein
VIRSVTSTAFPDTTPAWHPRAVAAVSRETDLAEADRDGDTARVAGAGAGSAGVDLAGLTAAELVAAAAPPGLVRRLVERTPIAQAAEAALVVQGRARAPLPRPDRTRLLAVANQKGGVGKTTTTVNVAAALAAHDLAVLVVDLDPQGNASTALGVDRYGADANRPGVYETLVEGLPLADVVRPVPGFATLRCVPSSLALAGAEIELVPEPGREYRLRDALHCYLARCRPDERPDYVFLDCPPSLGLLTLNALVAGTEVLVPIQCEYYALEGVTQLVHTIDLVTEHLNPALRVSTVLLTMYDARTRLSAQVATEVRSHFAGQVLRTAIPRSVRLSEAPGFQQSVLTYDPGSSGALSYLEAARELALRTEVPS